MTASRRRVPAAEVDHDLCAGVAMCVQYAPNAFRLDESGQSVFDPDGEWTAQELTDAVDGCPMAAIREPGSQGWAR
ncbi:MAG: ferredoxin [Nocardiopsaceae bacterium]|nr:ferredoxin [Nocardiopsaceae bacterium]